jgi:hypothetical protein
MGWIMITDEMVEKAWLATSRDPFKRDIRAALEAVAPLIVAQELRNWADHRFDVISTKSLRARAQELDPK